jgi:SAM-dependent methyltransferase
LSQFGDVEGVETDPEIVDAQGRWKTAIHIGPFDDTFKPEKRYSLILMLDVIEHVPQPEAMLRRARELLAPGGLIVVTVPALECLWTTHDDLNRHYRRFSKTSLRAAIQAAGLSEQSCQYFFAWICPLKLMIGWKERLLRSSPRPPGIPFAPLNWLFYGISRLEEALLRHAPAPWGNSLLLVANCDEPSADVGASV